MKTICRFSDVSEHDMDMLFLEEFVCSEEFTRIFTDMVGVSDPKVLSVHSSKTDVSLGESDMTVVVQSNNERIGLLIEDKIAAIAMPEQSARYSLRGRKGIERGDYDRFFVFIIAPQKYLSQNAEAQKAARIAEAEGQVARFNKMFGEYKDFPLITKKRLFYETMESLLPDLNVVISDGSTQTFLPLDPINVSGGAAQ